MGQVKTILDSRVLYLSSHVKWVNRPCLHMVLRCILVNRITSRWGRHIPFYIRCII